MSLTAESAAQQVQERLKALQSLIHNIDAIRRRNDTNLNSILHIQEKCSAEIKSNNVALSKMKNLYKMGMQDAAEEEDLLRQALMKIQEIRSIRNERRVQARKAGNKETMRRGALMEMLQIIPHTLPLFVSKIGEKVPPLCGVVPAGSNYISKPGDMVAALAVVKGDEHWILAEVVQYLSGQNKYEVDDVDEEQKDRYILPKRKVIPLPLMRVNPETDGHALFPVGTKVLALYPSSTCFYKAIIYKLPTRANEEYLALFDDQSYPEGYSPPLSVPQQYVIQYK